jgi:hypothetical protein
MSTILHACRRVIALVVVLAACSLGAASATAQQQLGSVQGTITDSPAVSFPASR